MAGLFFLALPTFAFVGAIAASFLVYGIAAVGGRFSMATLLLAGVAVNAFLGAVVTAIIILLPDNEALREILFWLAGGLDSRSWEHVRISAPLILGATAMIVLMARDLNLLMLGDDEARSMGVRVGLARPMLLAAAALATGAAVAVSGTIAFVGLVTPHILRLVLGPDHRVLIPMSAAGGAVFVIVADTVARDHRAAGRVSRRCSDRLRRRAVFHLPAHQEQASGLLALRAGIFTGVIVAIRQLRTLIVPLAVLLALTLAACSSESREANSPRRSTDRGTDRRSNRGAEPGAHSEKRFRHQPPNLPPGRSKVSGVSSTPRISAGPARSRA